MIDGLIDGLMSDFFGVGAIPPESVARHVLGIGEEPLDVAAVKSVFRFRVRLLRPDLADVDGLCRADVTGQLEALLWARDDLLERARKAERERTWRTNSDVTAKGVRTPHSFTRHVCSGGCGRDMGLIYRGAFAGYCYGCSERERQAQAREARRRARADTPCATCGTRFTPARADARYCSPACRQKAYRDRKAGA